MNKIIAFFKRHKVTIMVIPSTEKSIKQVKFNMAGAVFILVGLIIINASLLISTLVSKATSDTLSTKNTELAENLLMTEDKIAMLQNINTNKIEEVNTLKASLKSSTDFLTARLVEMNETQNYVAQLVSLFNQETNSDLAAPVSRSFSRTSGDDVTPEMSEDEILLAEIDSLIANDDISTIINEQTEGYKELVSKMESQLSYLATRPDFYPASGTFSSPFGYRKDPITNRTTLHNGIDISNKKGTPIYAAGSGIVTFAGYDGNFGRVLIIDHGYGYESVYAHCNSLLYVAGDSVEKGEQVATMGTSGRTTGNHLHFEIRYNGTPINPLKLISN